MMFERLKSSDEWDDEWAAHVGLTKLLAFEDSDE